MSRQKSGIAATAAIAAGFSFLWVAIACTGIGLWAADTIDEHSSVCPDFGPQLAVLCCVVLAVTGIAMASVWLTTLRWWGVASAGVSTLMLTAVVGFYVLLASNPGVCF